MRPTRYQLRQRGICCEEFSVGGGDCAPVNLGLFREGVRYQPAGSRAEGTDASLAQGLERVAVNHKVAGSIPAGGVFCSQVCLVSPGIFRCYLSPPFRLRRLWLRRGCPGK